MTDLIYKPSGQAAEYSPGWACNLFRGCVHGCTYCYAPKVLHMDRQAFHAGSALKYPDLLPRLEREAARKAAAGVTGRVFLCFTTDPYQAWDAASGYTRQAIEILHRHGFSVDVLTKGGNLALRDIDLFGPDDHFGVTLTGARREVWEPEAAPVYDRVAALKQFHTRGIHTWVSCEPVIEPRFILTFIVAIHNLVDVWKIGKLNYHPHAQTIDWPAFAREVVAMLQAAGANYRLKDDLACYVPAADRARGVDLDGRPWEGVRGA